VKHPGMLIYCNAFLDSNKPNNVNNGLYMVDKEIRTMNDEGQNLLFNQQNSLATENLDWQCVICAPRKLFDGFLG
jgi:hypothetical protein